MCPFFFYEKNENCHRSSGNKMKKYILKYRCDEDRYYKNGRRNNN